MNISLDRARLTQVPALRRLINAAYRGDEGWTRETDIVSGNRVQVPELERVVADPSSHMLVHVRGERVIACICIQPQGADAHFGLFAVDPQLQGAGLGGRVLVSAEEYALRELAATRFMVVVISQRPELIAYYERRGYRRTGRVEPYPIHLDVGTPIAPGLTVEHLIKNETGSESNFS